MIGNLLVSANLLIEAIRTESLVHEAAEALEDKVKEIESSIPHGDYCYSYTGNQESCGIPETRRCPFWFLNSLGYGDCILYVLNGENGDENLDILLDDQCKICGINKDERYD